MNLRVVTVDSETYNACISYLNDYLLIYSNF